MILPERKHFEHTVTLCVFPSITALTVLRFGLTGLEAEKLLGNILITVNKNTIPYDTEKPFITSGIRLGSAAMTTRGFTKDDFHQVGLIISKCFKNKDNLDIQNELRSNVLALTDKYPI